MTFTVVWAGGLPLTEALERDYADMKGEGWDLIYVPPSPLTTPWAELCAHMRFPDPNQFVATELERSRKSRRGVARILKDWSREYSGAIAQQGSRR